MQSDPRGDLTRDFHELGANAVEFGAAFLIFRNDFPHHFFVVVHGHSFDGCLFDNGAMTDATGNGIAINDPRNLQNLFADFSLRDAYGNDTGEFDVHMKSAIEIEALFVGDHHSAQTFNRWFHGGEDMRRDRQAGREGR